MKVTGKEGANALGVYFARDATTHLIWVRLFWNGGSGRVSWRWGLISLDSFEVAALDGDDLAVGVA